MRIAVILNSRVKRKNKVLEEFRKLELSQVATSLTILETESIGHGIELAKTASTNHDCIIAAGGDGTINEVVNGIILSGLEKEKRPILAIYPCGSANDYSRSVLIEPDIDALIDLIRRQHTHPIDTGKVEYITENGETAIRYFVNVLDCGIGAEVVKKVNNSRKTLGVEFTFVKAILSCFLTYQKSTLVCKTDTGEFTEKVLSQVFSIGKYFGNGIKIAPDAKPDNGSFVSVTIGDVSFTDFISNLRKLRKGKKITHPKMVVRKCTTATLTPQEYSCSVEADGEFLGFTPIKLNLCMHELKLLSKPFPE